MIINDLEAMQLKLKEEQENITALKEQADIKVYIINLLLEIINEAKSTNDFLQKENGKQLEQENANYILVEHEEEIIVSWWCPSTKHHNDNFRNELDKIRMRLTIIKMICDKLGIIYNCKEEVTHPYGENTNIASISTFQIPTSMLNLISDQDIETITSILDRPNPKKLFFQFGALSGYEYL